MATTRLHQLADHGQSVWIDFLSRDLLRSGDLSRLMREDARFRRHLEPDHLRQGPLGRRRLRRADRGRRRRRQRGLPRVGDARRHHRLRPAATRLGRTAGRDGYVSIEVDPNLADDTEAQNGVAQQLCRCAAALTTAGRAETATQLLACSEALHEELGTTMLPHMVIENEKTLAKIHAALDDFAFAEAWEGGRKLGADEAVTLALDSLGAAGATPESRSAGV